MFGDKSFFCHLFVERSDLLSCLFFNNLLLAWKGGWIIANIRLICMKWPYDSVKNTVLFVKKMRSDFLSRRQSAALHPRPFRHQHPWYICQRCWSDYGNALTASRCPDCNYGCLYPDPDKNAPEKSKENTQMMTLYKKSINDISYNSYYHVVSSHLTLANDRADCRIICHRWILKFFQ